MLLLCNIKQRLILHEFHPTMVPSMRLAMIKDVCTLEKYLPCMCMIPCVHFCVHAMDFVAIWYASQYSNMLKYEYLGSIIASKAKSRSAVGASVLKHLLMSTTGKEHPLTQEWERRRQWRQQQLPDNDVSGWFKHTKVQQKHLTKMNEETSNIIITERSKGTI